METVFRKNAAIVVFRADKKVLICERIRGTDHRWQFPQGGIDAEETPEEAAVRELREETSITSAKPVARIDKPIRYVFPPEIKQSFLKRGIYSDGQDHYWFLFYFSGTDEEINLNTEEAEFSRYRWEDLNNTPELVIDFKKNSYRQMVKEFTPIIAQFEPY